MAPAQAQPDTQLRLERLLQGQGLTGDPVELTYQSIVPLAVTRNLRLLSTQLQVPIARAQYDQAVAARNPTLANNFFYIHQDRNLVQQNLPNTRYVLLASGYTLTQSSLYPLGQNQMLNRTTLVVPIYTGGRLESSMHLQEALVEAAKFGVDRARQSIAFEAKRQYLLTLLAAENVAVSHKIVEQASEIRSFAQSRLNAGVGTKLDVLQAGVALANAQDAVVKTRASLDKAKADLAAVVDLPLLTEFAFKDSLSSDDLLDKEPTPGKELGQLARMALGKRPELGELRQQLVANQERVHVAQADERPQLSLALNYDVIGNPAHLAGGPSLIVTLSIPIYDGGVSDARVKEFDIRDLQLKNEELRLIQDITVEVRNASLEVEEADSRLESARVAQKRAAEALRIATLRYQIGAGTSLEMVTAQTILANAEFALAEAHYRQLIARATLNFAVGTNVPEAHSTEVTHG